jgi:hypothetical protein
MIYWKRDLNKLLVNDAEIWKVLTMDDPIGSELSEGVYPMGGNSKQASLKIYPKGNQPWTISKKLNR